MTSSSSHRGAASALAVDRDPVRRAAFETHLTQFLGDHFTLLSEKTSRAIHLDVYVFEPSPDVPHVTLVTAGMSDLPMPIPGTDARLRMELMLGLPRGWPGLDPPGSSALAALALEENFWPLRLLKDVARYPSSFDASLSWGHMVDVSAGGLDRGPAPFSGAVIGPPLGYPAELMRAPTPRGDVQLLAVMPVTAAEVAFTASLPSGGEALVDRMLEAGADAVIAPGRASVVQGPAPWAVHLLMAQRHLDLGSVLSAALPELAEQLSEQGMAEHVLEAGAGEQVRLRVGGRIDPAAMEGALGADPAAEDLRTTVGEHACTVTLTPVSPGTGGPVTAVMALVTLLIEHSDPVALWFPHQDHVTSPADFAADVSGGVLIHYRVHPTRAPAGMRAASTRGLAALGGLEVLARSRRLSHHQLAQRIHAMVEGVPGQGAYELPAAGASIRFAAGQYRLTEAVDPISGAAVLELRAETHSDG